MDALNTILSEELDATTILLCILLVFVVTYWLQTPGNLPPGPIGWPLVGTLPNLAFSKYRTGLTTHEILTRLSKHYGEVYSMYMGRRLVMILNSPNAIREAFQNPLLQDRPQSAVLDDVLCARGVAQANGEAWKQQRRFTQNTFRSFGVGKSKFEEQILDEAEELLKQVIATNGEAFNIRHDLGNAVSNVICSAVFGKRYKYTDAGFKKLLDLLYRQFILLGSGGLNLFIPIMRYLQPEKQKKLRSNYNELYSFVGNVIDQHRAVFDSENLNDYIDVYLREIDISQKLGRESHITNKTMVASVGNLFGAGSDTVASTLYWALLYILQHPDIQNRIQKEIDEVVGRNRMPRLTDKPEMSYTEATLLEVARHASVLPIGAPHCASESTTLMGYHVPKGTIILPNFWGVHYNPTLWEDSDEFKPERFLDENGNKVCRQDDVLSFSVGRRNCLGENLAKMELFIFFSHLLHQFTFTKENDATQPDFSCIVGASRYPHPYKLRAIRRE